MKICQRILVAIILLVAVAAFGQEAVDSAGVVSRVDSVVNDEPVRIKQLGEVVVKGKRSILKTDGTVSVPTKLQLDAAMDGFDLLRRMANPSIMVDVVSNNVTTLTGNPVTFFIDGSPASNNDVDAINMKRVLRVEYLEFPEDARFKGAPYVVNFVLRPIVWGGYTRLQETVRFMADVNSSSNVYSQYTREKMTYDLYAGYSYNNNHHFGSDYTTYFHLLDAEGQPYEQMRREATTYSKSRSIGLPITARVKYATEKFEALNTVGFNFSQAPGSQQEGMLSFGGSSVDDYTYWSRAASINRSVGWFGVYYFALPKKFYLNISPKFQYARNYDSSLYTTSVSSSDAILNNSWESAVNAGLDFYLNKQFNQRLSTALRGAVSYAHNHVDYQGSSQYVNRFSRFDGTVGLTFSGNWSKVRAVVMADAEFDRTETNGQSYTAVSPQLLVNLSYVPQRNHRFSFEGKYFSYQPGLSQLSDNVLRQNEFLYISGNPDYRAISGIIVNLNYTWLCSDKVNLTSSNYYSYVHDSGVYVYTPWEDGRALLKRPVNSGHHEQFITMLKVSYTPIESLQFQGDVRCWHMRQTGLADSMVNGFNFLLKAYYYIKAFNIYAWYERCGTSLQQYTGAVRSYRPVYGISAGWRHNDLKVNVFVHNFLRNDWIHKHNTLDVPNYQYYGVDYSMHTHRYVSVSVSYTFRYGKQKRNPDEIGETDVINSAILK